MSDSVRPHRQQPTRLFRPWDSPGKNTGVGCHFLLQCMKVKSESEVSQSYPTFSDPWTAAHQAPLAMGFSRQEYWSGVPLPSLGTKLRCVKIYSKHQILKTSYSFYVLSYNCMLILVIYWNDTILIILGKIKYSNQFHFFFSKRWFVFFLSVQSLSRVRLLVTHGLQPTRLLCPWDFPGKSTGVGCHCLLFFPQ